MAQKRMFDRAIIDTDRFMDLSMSMKGTYFVFGMEADDEGFVSYKKVVRIHGVNEDDIKVLVAKGFFVMFETGVVVITEWHKNNWLNGSRIKPTEYQTEKKMLLLTPDKKYVLSNRLALVKPEESRVEESRVEESGRKKVSSVELPDWLNKETWTMWEEYRKGIKKKLTPISVKQQLKFLGSNQKDHVAILERSIQNGWTGLFVLDGKKSVPNALQGKKGKYDKFN